jgi:uncharacterized membrane protein
MKSVVYKMLLPIMDSTHIHLLITHLPIFGSLMGAIVLAHALWTKSNDTKVAAYILFILSSIGAGIAYYTGEGAEEGIEHIQGVVEATIQQHESFALFALLSLILLGLVAFFGLILTVTKSPFSRTMAKIVLVVALISFGLVAKTGYYGGQIRHTELNEGTIPTSENTEHDTD